MGKKKENLDELKRENPAENNWETPEEKIQETAESGKMITLESTIREGLTAAMAHVPEEYKKDNPVMAWSLRTDGATFVFRDGRKYRVEIQWKDMICR